MPSPFRLSPMDALTPTKAPAPVPAPAPGTATDRAAAGQGYAAGAAARTSGKDGAGPGLDAQCAALAPQTRPDERMAGGLSPEDGVRVSANITAAHGHLLTGWQDRSNAVLGLGGGLLEDKIDASPGVLEELAKATIAAVTSALASAATGGLAAVGAGVQAVARAALAAALKAGVNETIAAFGAEPQLSVAGFASGQLAGLVAARDAMMAQLEGAQIERYITQGARPVEASAAYSAWARAFGAHALARQTASSMSAWGRCLERRALGKRGRRNHRDGQLAGSKEGILEVVLDWETLGAKDCRVASVEIVGVGSNAHRTLAAQAKDLPLEALLGDHGLTLHITDTIGFLDLTTTADDRSNPVFPTSGRSMLALRRRAREVYGLDADEAMLAAAARLVVEVGGMRIGDAFGAAAKGGDQ